VVNGANGSSFYRQSSVDGGASSLRGGTDWTNQAIQAEVTPTAFNGADRWFGVGVRYVDANNQYYLTLRTTNVVEIRRNLNGQFVTLASAPLTVTAGKTYRLRLEAIGSRLRAFVDGALVAEATDKSLTHGQAALMMYKTAADYDNVVVTPNPRTTLVSDSFPDSSLRGWTFVSGTWTRVFEGSNGLMQSSQDADAKMINGVPTEDQIVETHVKPTSFNGSDRWFGIAARYVDASNYYYLTVRNSNQVSLRRLTNGAVTELDSAPLTVSRNKTYKLRLEVIGDQLRGYVDDKLLLEARDSVLTRGQYGLLTYKTTAQYDDFSAVAP